MIDMMYSEDMETREDPAPYEAFALVLERAGVFDGAQSVMDVGCSTGHLLSALQGRTDLSCYGVEYFNYQKQAAPISVRDHIFVADIREPLALTLSADVVICTEVGEHIDPLAIGVFLDNLKSACNLRLVLTWSGRFPSPEAPPQHVCCLPEAQVRRLMASRGFELDELRTRNSRQLLGRNSVAYPWWLDSLSVWTPA